MSECEILGFSESDEPGWAASDMIHRHNKSGLVRYWACTKLILAENTIIIFTRVHKHYFTELQWVHVQQFYINNSWVDQSKLHVSLSRWVRVRLRYAFADCRGKLRTTTILTSSCYFCFEHEKFKSVPFNGEYCNQLMAFIVPSRLQDFAAFLFFDGFLFFSPARTDFAIFKGCHPEN